MHNVIAFKYGINDYEELDHIDRNGLNNQKDNLRICTRGQNNHNRRNYGALPKGVTIQKDKYKKKNGDISEYVIYKTSISVNGKSIYLGKFKNIEDAIDAYSKASKKYYPNYH